MYMISRRNAGVAGGCLVFASHVKWLLHQKALLELAEILALRQREGRATLSFQCGLQLRLQLLITIAMQSTACAEGSQVTWQSVRH